MATIFRGDGSYTTDTTSTSSVDWLASLQTPVAQANAANQVSVGPTGVGASQFVGGNQIQLPSWMSSDPDSHLGELKQSYSDVGTAYDPTDQVNARNAAIGYQTQAGARAANNAATEYSNRAAQSGGSGLGAGTVKAQNMLGVYKQNADLRTEAADVAAQTRQQGVTLAAQIANNLGSLRNSYLGTLASYASNQSQLATQNNQYNQSLALDNWKAQQGVASDAANRQQQYASLQNDAMKSILSSELSQSSLALQAAQALQKSKGPTGQWTSDLTGRVTSGLDTYNAQKAWTANQTTANNALARMTNYY